MQCLSTCFMLLFLYFILTTFSIKRMLYNKYVKFSARNISNYICNLIFHFPIFWKKEINMTISKFATTPDIFYKIHTMLKDVCIINQILSFNLHVTLQLQLHIFYICSIFGFCVWLYSVSEHLFYKAFSIFIPFTEYKKYPVFF